MPDKPEELHIRIGKLREAARVEGTTEPTPVRPSKDLVDAAIATTAQLAAAGTKGAERRQAIGAVQVGSMMTEKGAEPRRLTRAEKVAKAEAWGSTLDEEARTAFIISEKFNELSDSAQEAISTAWANLDEKEAADEVGAMFDLEAAASVDTASVDIDELTAADDAEDEVTDDDYEAMFNQAEWESEAT
jgi:hypothetical protein